MTTMRQMDAGELHRISEIDRSERITQEYVLSTEGLRLIDVDLDVPGWFRSGGGEHSVQERIDAWLPLIERGGVLVGAFTGDELVGFAIYEPHLAKGVANMAALYVSRPLRRSGIGRLLVEEVVRLARADGAERLYVSATPTRDTVDFYMRHGFNPVAVPNEKLFATEPRDIHMDRPV